MKEEEWRGTKKEDGETKKTNMYFVNNCMICSYINKLP